MVNPRQENKGADNEKRGGSLQVMPTEELVKSDWEKDYPSEG